METKEFDRMQAIGRKLREIFDRDKTPFAPGCEDYLVRSVEEATRLTMRALDAAAPYACDCNGENGLHTPDCNSWITPRQ